MKTEKRIIPPEPVEPQFEVVVTLTKQEALDLWLLAGKISGVPANTVRETTDPLWDQLGKALGLTYKDADDYRRLDRYKDLPHYKVNDKF